MEIRSDLNDAIHDWRSLQLKKLPKGANVILTAESTDSSYFDWIRSCYGPVGKHIAIVKFAALFSSSASKIEPAGVTLTTMHGVASNSVDLVFFGQITQHLLVSEIVELLTEASRVLRPAGLLVIDGPNRLITAKAEDAQPESVIEFSPSEARAMFEAAGFEVVSVEGLFVCSDPQTGERSSSGVETIRAWDYQRRASEGLQHPDSCYIWWMEARKRSEPNRAVIEQIVLEAFEIAWPERLARTHSIIGHRSLNAQGQSCFDIPALMAGAAMYGPYAPLDRGLYQVTFVIQSIEADSARELPVEDDEEILALEIFSDRHEPNVIAARKVLRRDLPNGRATELSLVFRLTEVTFAVQFRVLTNGSGPALRILACCKVRQIA